MKNLSLKGLVKMPFVKKTEPYLVIVILILVWFTAPNFMEATAGRIDPSIWLLVLLAMISFLLMLALCWWLLKRIWVFMGLPRLDDVVLQFNSLSKWEQLKFVLCLFALLLLAAVGALVAVL
ncbi:hypothetical protein ABIE26_003240 [Pedobacter africanus]|uniref:Uncharacterized protein n=1 Tax=Pedobacter africanus TaxID=151894 RepID=A0ACC6KZA8_9SPHI|nr:hypothetical protein [Pedobacter africanus]MDR6784594.1 hypothetical protein [Pedobacter africanus]